MLTFAENLKRLRSERKISLREMATDLNFSHSAIYLWENNKREPTLEMLVKLSEYFKVSVNEIIGTKNFGTNEVSPLENLTEKQQNLIKKIKTMNDAQCIRLDSYADRLIDEFAEQEQIKNKNFKGV